MPVPDATALPSTKPQREVSEIKITIGYVVSGGQLVPKVMVEVKAQRVVRDPLTLAILVRGEQINALFEDGQINGANRAAVTQLVTAAEGAV